MRRYNVIDVNVAHGTLRRCTWPYTHFRSFELDGPVFMFRLTSVYLFAKEPYEMHQNSHNPGSIIALGDLD